MPRVLKVRTKVRGDKAHITIYQAAARGRKRIHRQLTLPIEDLKADAALPEEAQKIKLDQ